MRLKAILAGLGLALLALGGWAACETLRQPAQRQEPASMAPPEGEDEIAPVIVDGGGGKPLEAKATPFGMELASAGDRRAWAPSPTPMAERIQDGGVYGGFRASPTATPTRLTFVVPAYDPAAAAAAEKQEEESNRQRLEDLLAALPTPLPVYKTPTPAPAHVQIVASGQSEFEILARKVGGFDWSSYESEGYRFARVDEGERVTTHVSYESFIETTCAESSGLSYDLDENLLYEPFSHFIWAWGVDAGGIGGCWAIPAGVDWFNKDAARPRADAEWVNSRRALNMREPLVFYNNEREYTMPPWREDYAYIGYGEIWFDSDGRDFLCEIRGLPWALWDEERGFRAISSDDMRIYSSGLFSDGEIARMDEIRGFGHYVIVNGEGSAPDEGAYCWSAPNAAEVPVEPCYICRMSQWER